ncbi:hypothetical protein Kfla_3892 [Kribbella flavida DSM 17836]|uniref:Mycothiol-dependent maleylpyruvate isomerase metal-binding domain-containing protein n=1 Tax=Kribbella flavida (strain DSM 17836 / JCM 10339 / NBRC 14399) TaxID=479435 RepID=D2PQ21_KRIFD|nr:maleylpyruvate isomerase family mycothiol-dependent enzyme [Kribbella flavida]ADB32945.1 hypothetical protein Kfla_3892 [Kribbella flavida DSM 17836]
MTSTADQTIDALRTGHDELVAKVARFGPDELVRDSAAAEWTVAQVLSHLGSGAEIHLAILESALDGGTAPEGDFYQSVWGRWDAMSPAEQAANFPAANETLVNRFEKLDDKVRAELMVDFGFLPEPIDLAGAAGMRLSEFALHSWDVQVAFDSTARIAPDATALLLDRVDGLLGFAAKADQYDGKLTLAVHTTDPNRDFGLVVADTVSLLDVPDSVDGELTAPAEYVVRLITGRHRAEHTPASVSVTGPATLDDLRRIFPGY